MLKVNYKILPKRQKRRLSVGARAVHHTFYDIPVHNPSFTWEYHVEDYSGFCYQTEDIAALTFVEESVNEKYQKNF